MHIPGPNFMWSVDGYDKLRQWGFYIHGAVDAYSRYIIWLEVGLLSWKYGSSTSNQRIEAWWSHLRKYKSQFWIELFTKIEVAGEWIYGNNIDYECLIYVFMPLLKVELFEFRQEWNKLNDTQNYGFKVNYEEYKFIYNKYCSNNILNIYLSNKKIFELDFITSKILEELGETNINIINARLIYNILKNIQSCI
ncbi:17044_t:CDS:2 [Gigaspora margarita]|uniref:17044_t:CDS:1 n=1 Tax=Gigaspora margarita TaxID=4874 RepID=A0ABN7VLY2_GIGMA|nr:17044_t:CDS:2 [Gigaspora margarita]